MVEGLRQGAAFDTGPDEENGGVCLIVFTTHHRLAPPAAAQLVMGAVTAGCSGDGCG